MSAALAIARLLDTLETLGAIARHVRPPAARCAGGQAWAIATPRCVRRWPKRTGRNRCANRSSVPPRQRCAPAMGCAPRGGLGSMDSLPRQSYRALRQVSRAMEALYPLAAVLPTVDRFFLTSDAWRSGLSRSDAPTGVLHAGNDTAERGGFSVYVPEDYDPSRGIRWSWRCMAVPDTAGCSCGAGCARCAAAASSWLAPTAIGDTWSLIDPPLDSGNLLRVVETDQPALGRWIRQPAADRHERRRDVHAARGLRRQVAVHPSGAGGGELPSLLLTMADAATGSAGCRSIWCTARWTGCFRCRWRARRSQALTAAGANVTYREIADLSHVYPREEGGRILDWLLG